MSEQEEQQGLDPKPCEQCGTVLPTEMGAWPRPASMGGGVVQRLRYARCEVCAERRRLAQEAHGREVRFQNRRMASGLPQKCWGLSLDPDAWAKMGLTVDANNRRGVKAAQDWVKGDAGGLMLHGPEGLGKSVIGMCAAMDCLRRDQEVLWVSERDLIDSYRGKRRDDDRNVGILARSIEVLVVDDMGRHKMGRGTAYLTEMYFDIFDARLGLFGDAMKTLITTQLTHESLIEWCEDDAAMHSRIMSILGGNIEILGGQDRRRAVWTREDRRE